MGIVIDAGNDWNLTTLGVIKGALQLCQAIGVGETVNDNDASLCMTALDGLLKELPIHGFQRPRISSTPVAVTWSALDPGVANPPGDYFGAPLLKFTAANGEKRQLRQVAKAEWETLDTTATAAYPEIVYVSPDLTFNLWPTPTQNPGLTLSYQSILPDLMLAGGTGLEQQYVNLLQFMLADEISLKYGVSPGDRAEIAARATQKKFMMLQWATDQGPICITVDD